MKAIQVVEPLKLAITELPIPQITDPHQVLIRVHAAGICGSDVSIYRGTSPVAVYPRVIGHEFVGEVTEVGAAVTRVKPGDRVTVDPVINCGVCRVCQKGRSNVCADLQVIGVHEDGGYREFAAVPESSVYLLPEEMPWEHAVMVEPYAVAAQVADRGGVSEGDTVLILGSGQIALMVLQVCKLLGARCIMTDVVEERLVRAKAYGADAVINTATQDVCEQVLALTDGIGADIAVDAACVGKTLEQAAESVRAAGVIVTMGFANRTIPITELSVTKKELEIRGSRLNNRKFAQVIDWFRQGKIDPVRMITHTLPFTEVLTGMDKMKNEPETTMKVVLTFSCESSEQ